MTTQTISGLFESKVVFVIQPPEILKHINIDEKKTKQNKLWPLEMEYSGRVQIP